MKQLAILALIERHCREASAHACMRVFVCTGACIRVYVCMCMPVYVCVQRVHTVNDTCSG